MFRKVLKKMPKSITNNFSQKIQRKISETNIKSLKSIIGPENVLTESVEGYTMDWLGQMGYKHGTVVLPRSTTEIQDLLKFCNNEGIKVTPQSGNTSLVDGAIASDPEEIILSLRKLDKIHAFDPLTEVLSCDAGCILQNLQDHLEPYNYETPFDLGARGSCLIGGNVSTMAGGINFVKHGNLRNYIVGLEVVLADGSILDLRSRSRKDNTGTDLKQLFIGSEGTLGVVTAVDMVCVAKSKHSLVLLTKVEDFGKVLEITKLAKEEFAVNLNAIEYMDYLSYKIVYETNGDRFNYPFELESFGEKENLVLLELGGNDEEFLQKQLEDCISRYEDLFSEAILAETGTQEQEIWGIREGVAEAYNKAEGYVLKYDFSIDINLFEESCEYFRDLLGPRAEQVSGYGHIGDGNIHVNIILNERDFCVEETKQLFEPKFMEYIVKNRGSISAEHGIGLAKAKYLKSQKDPKVLKKMWDLKNLFDPKGILNSNKILQK